MNNPANTYKLEEEKTENGLKYFFISEGKEDIIKVIEYTFVQELFGINTYNLGFGDYHIENDSVLDDVNSNNGDGYKVFNTVLGTIPVFFEIYKDCQLIVQGSDSSSEYIANCRLNCKKRCDKQCKNFNRRINLYTHFINKNLSQLIADYQFFGGRKNEEDISIFEDYIPYKRYDSILLMKKH